jgi:hypothetical protein
MLVAGLLYVGRVALGDFVRERKVTAGYIEHASCPRAQSEGEFMSSYDELQDICDEAVTCSQRNPSCAFL